MKNSHRFEMRSWVLLLGSLGLLGLLPGCGASPAVAAGTSPSAASSAPQAAPSSTSAGPTPTPSPVAEPKITVSDAARAAAGAEGRSDDDKALDAGRHPGELLSFFRVGPGMKVAELGAGGGYTAELLARTVGPSGTVYGQNSKWILDRFAEKPWSARLAKPVMKNVMRADREFDDPLPPEAHDLDAVFCVLFYHDTFWLDVDRDKMNRAVFKALKPGGVYAIVDHSGRPGTGATEVKTLHRIEEKVVRAEIEKAGFRLRAEGSFLRNPADSRDWNDSPKVAAEKRGTSDRFVLAFEKP